MTEELHFDELLQSKIKTLNKQSIFTSNSKALKREIEVTNQAIQQVGEQIKLHIHKKIIMPKQQQISLISGNNRSRSNNETVKRNQPNQGSPEMVSNEYSRDDIRRKIILENARLKTSLDVLRQDVNIYKQNQMSILEVLKESKVKIVDYKSQIKNKSKKISELIDTNMILKAKIDQLQGKVSNITSYSEWQQNQIQQLKKEVAQKFLQLQQTQVLKAKIDKLQQVLKEYQQQLPQDSRSNITHSPHPLSTHSLSEPRIPTPYSIKQMRIQDLQMIRQYDGGDQEYNRLEEYNLSLKAKIEEIESELEVLKVDNANKQSMLEGFRREKEEKEEDFNIKINNILEKSQQLTGKIEEKEINITNIQKQMQLQRQNNLKKQQQYLSTLNTLKLDIVNLQKILDEKTQSIANLHQQLNEKQQFFNRQFEQISLQFNANEQKYTSQLRQSQQKIKDLQKMLNEDELKMQQILAQNEQLNQFRNQVHQKYQYAQKIIKERKDYQNFIEKLQSKIHYLENLPNDNLEYYQSKLEESQKYIRSLESQKNDHHAEFEQYALQIRLLKNQIKDLSRQHRDHIDHLDPSINVIQQQPQQSQGGLVSNTSLQQRQNMISGVHPHEQQQRNKQDFIPIFQSFPIEKEDELPPRKKSEDKSKNRSSEVYQRVIRNLREENQSLRCEKQEIIKKYTMDIVETNNQYFIEQEKQAQLNERIKKLEEELLQAGNNFIAKKFQLEVKQAAIQEHQQRLNEYQQHIQHLQMENSKQLQQIKQKSDLVEKYKQIIQTSNSKLRDLTANLSILSSQKQQLIQHKVKYQLSLQKMLEQQNKLSSSKDMLTTSLQLQMNYKESIENQLMESRRLIRLAEEEKLTEKTVKEKVKKENQELYYKIREIEERMKILSNQKNTLQEELIGYISDKEKLIGLQNKLQSESQELKIMKKQHQQRIKVLEKQLLLKDHQISQLSKELSLSNNQNNQLESSLQKKSQELLQSQRKIQQMQQYQRQTMSQIQQKLSQLSTIINEQKAQILKLTTQKQQYLNKKETLTRSVTQLNQSQQSLKEVTDTMQRQLQILNEENNLLKQNINKICEENNQIRAENNQLKQNIIAFERQKKVIIGEKQKLTIQYQILKKQNEQTKLKLRTNQKMFKDISLNIANLKQSLDFSRSQQSQHSPTSLRQNQDSISLKLQQNQHSVVSIDNLKQEISQIQHKHKYVIEDYEKKLRSTSSHFQEASKQKEGKIQQLNSMVKMLKQENTELVHSKDSLQLIIKQLKQTMAEYINSIEQLEVSLSSEREIISSKDLVISGLEKTINIKKSQIDQKQKIIHEIQEKHRLLKIQFESKATVEEKTDIRLKQMQREWGVERQSQKKVIITLQDQLQVSKKMMQQAEEEYRLKVNKINKQLSNCKFLLEQTQKQSSFRLEQSTKSITQVKNQLKMFNQTLRQKEQQIKELKLSINNLKQQNHQIRIKSERHQEESNHYNSVKQQLQSYISTLDAEIQSQKQELKRQRQMRQKYKDQQSTLTNEINRLNLGIQQKASEKEMIIKEKQFLYSKLQRQVHEKVKMQQKMKDTTIQIKSLQQNYDNLEQQYKIIRRKKQQEQSQLQVSTSNLIQQRKMIEDKYFNLIKEKDDHIEQLKSGENKIHKQYQTRIQNLCLEHKDLLLEVENQHSKQIEKKDEQIEKVIRQSKTYIDHFKDKEKQAQQELEKVKQTLKKLQKQFENQRGELTDKVLQLTQQNNQGTEVIQNLRNGIVSKGNQIEQCKDIIEKLQQQLEDAKAQLSQFNSSKSIPVQGEDEYQLSHARQKISKLQIIIKQKQKIEKQLNEKIDKMKQRQNRQRNSSVESLASKSRVFDERNINLLQQLDDTKNRLESAEAYIQLLEDQEHKLKEEINKDGKSQKNANAQDLQAQIEDLKMKVQFLQALNHQLQNCNDTQSVRSVREKIRNDSFLREPQKLKKSSVSQISDSNNMKNQGYFDSNLNKKIQLLIDFIDSYTRDNSSGEKQQELKSQLNHSGLQDLLSTIFYRLQKQAIIYKDKEHAITDLHEQIDTLHEQIRILKQNIAFLDRKCSVLDGYQKKYQQSQKSIEELINSKMKDEADVAQCRSYIEELESRLGKYQSKREESKKEALEILEEQNESSSDSMMSESADSEIPSSVSQSNNFKSSIAMSRRLKGDYLSMSKSMVRTKSFNVNEQKIRSSQFLRKTVVAIHYLEEQVEAIEKQLHAKTKLLNIALNDNISKEQLINKLSMIQSKMKMNDKQIKSHFETSELQVAGLIKDLLRYRQQQDQYGLQNQSRRKIQDYLSLLQQQLTKSSKFYEEESVKIQENSRKSEMNRLSLHEIKEDAVNEDKGSSIVYPRGQVLRSFSNSQGATQSLDINQIKVNYNEALKQLHQTHDELSTKQDQLRNINNRYMGIQNEVCGILDEIRIYFQEDQYLFDQVENIKKILSKFQQQEASTDKVRQSIDRQEQDRMAILVQSNKKELQLGSRKVENPFEKIIKFTEEEFKQSVNLISNQHLKQIYTKISQILDSRYDQCLQFLNTQKSLIADILRIRNDEGFLQQTINKIASKLTQQQVADIITNSPNVQQANKILTSLLKEEDSKSMISDDQDFSPNIDKIQDIRNKIYSRPTQLCLAMHNQLIEILGAPTRQDFYGLIEQFYYSLKEFQEKYRNNLSQRDEYSQNHSIRLKKVLQIPSNNLEDSIQKFDFMEIKHQKNRSSSCMVNIVEES